MESASERQIHYDGIGADPSGVHTPERFLEIMEREIQNKNEKNPLLRLVKYSKFKDFILPDDFIFFTLEDWVDYSGAFILVNSQS